MKDYVDMIVLHTKEGKMKPLYVVWHNGVKYEVDKILEVRKAASLKHGGAGMRYTCRIQGTVRYLFFDRGKWFIDIP